MPIKRTRASLLCLLTIILGLVSRRITGIPLFIGDILYASMMFFIIRGLFIKVSLKAVCLVSMGICYIIEFSQLLQWQILLIIRGTGIGRLILGQGFLWEDIVAYTFGALLAMCLMKVIENREK